MTQDRPVLGMLLMLGFCVLAPMGDSIAKILGSAIPLLQLLLVRFALQAAFLLPVVLVTERTFGMSPRLYKLTALRTLLHIIGVGAMFLSLRYLPLADAIAIAFVMPFILLLLGRFVLNEEVGVHRLVACAGGFIGTLLVIQPSFAEVGLPALLPLVVAVDFALFILVTRKIAKEIDPISMQTISGFMAIPMLLVGLAVFSIFFDWRSLLVMPDGTQTALLLAIGALGTIAHLLMTWSLRFAPSATLAPMQYLEIPVATVLGYLVFSDLPNGIAAIGIGITICAGLYVVYREHAVSRGAIS
ncbi:DMT family transporter [Ahrensia sp. R2A130]|uniref:DMT family transporter n=1 Tax=Ahrensia sp. R2A130 TaxID=744979 RepID=UPI0001E08C28|nr:DMT family transporter [Ahrensia sp. R2A130]EFL89526.1 RarD family protein [Ahrensia sp. R2A130]